MNNDNIYKGGIIIFLNNQICPEGLIPYTIRRGDTLTHIAQLYNTDLQAILLANRNIEPSNLITGQQICIPLSIQIYPSCKTTNYYVVKNNDNFKSIANYFKVTELQLLYSNYGINTNDLYEGQILCIPVAQPPSQLIINLVDSVLSVIQNGNTMISYQIIKVSRMLPFGQYVILYKQVEPKRELGERYLGLSLPGIGIHGENTEPQTQTSSETGVILTNEDIVELFNLVTVGTVVTII